MPVDGHHPGTFLRRRGEPTDSGFQPLALDSAKFRSDRNQRLSFALSGPPDEWSQEGTATKAKRACGGPLERVVGFQHHPSRRE